MKLIFIYNANSGKFNTLIDISHKLFSQSTYQCSLCTLTYYDTLTENSIWKTFRLETDLEMEFYHKDEFESKFPNTNLTYPTILKLNNGELETLLDSKTLDTIIDVKELIKKLKSIL